MKKETLEEAAEILYQKGLQNDLSLSFYDGVMFGSEWEKEQTCNHNYILTTEDGHRVIKCQKCPNVQPI